MQAPLGEAIRGGVLTVQALLGEAPLVQAPLVQVPPMRVHLGQAPPGESPLVQNSLGKAPLGQDPLVQVLPAQGLIPVMRPRIPMLRAPIRRSLNQVFGTQIPLLLLAGA